MTNNTADVIKLYGTDEPVQAMRTLTAGPLTCQFDHGALRFIKIYGKESIRNIAFVIRNKDWGTYLPTLSNVLVEQNEDSFIVAFDAVCIDEQQEIFCQSKIIGTADGVLSFTTDYTAVTDFITNRTGFVVLHPLTGVAGHPVTVTRPNGDTEQAEFPELVDPIQPIKNISALTHEVLPGISVCCDMTGDTFEMEDQRQWNDASYKTYVRPLSKPWPYTIAKSESHQQCIKLTVLESTGQAASSTLSETSKPCVVTVSKIDNPAAMPSIGIGLEPQHLAGAKACQNLIRKLAPQQLVVWHELGKHNGEHLRQAAALSQDTDIKFELQAVIPDNDYTSEISELADQCRDAGLTLSAINVAPAIYLKSLMPGPSWPEVTDLADLYEEVRRQFPDVEVGGGMLSFFTELNRHRPPTDQLDFISHASNTITHASDDVSVTENLEAIPYITKTCRAFANGKPYHVGPSSIAMRFNPYGSKTMDNPDNKRIAMARMDPRQRGLVNSAWTTGYIAHMVRGGISCINLHAPTGEFGVFNYQEAWPRPGFDDSSKQVFPVYHVLAGFSQAAGKPQLLTHSTMSREVEAVAYEDDGNWVVWIANLTCDLRSVQVSGLHNSGAKVATLSVNTFDQCTDDSEGFERATAEAFLPELELGPYAVVRITTLA